jgi:cytochrome c-type biogenesis protein CcmH/NrfG
MSDINQFNIISKTFTMPSQQPVVAARNSLETVSIWALIVTLAVATLIFFPFSMSLITVKTFVLAAGMLVTLALYILARLSRGNIIFPPLLLVGALWLPAIAYVLSAAFSGIPFTSALWGIALEPDTLGFILSAAFLGTLAACVLRRPEQYRLFLRAGAWLFGIVTAIEVLVVIFGQFISKISPSFSIIGSFQDLAFFLGLGIISVLISFRFLELPRNSYRLLVATGILALLLLAIANSQVVWVLLALVSLGLFIEAVMQRGPKTVYADIDEMDEESKEPFETSGNNYPLVMPLVVLVISLFFLVGGTLSGALSNALHINILSVSPSWQSTLSIGHNVYSSSPFFGSGPGTFGVDWLKYRDASLNSTIFWSTNFSSGIGFIPTSLVTTGLLGALAWILFIGFFVAFGLRVLIVRTPTDPFIRYSAILSFVAALYLFTVAIFGSPSAIILVLAFVFAGLFISTTRFAELGSQWGVVFSRKPRIGFVIVFLLTIILLAAVFVAYVLTERYIAVTELTYANAAFSAGNFDSANKDAQNSISFAPSATAYQIEAGIANAELNQIAASSTMSATAAQQAFQTSLSAGINAALTATSIAPSDYQNWVMLGNLYAEAVPLGVSGSYNNAKTAYQKAQALDPTDPQIQYIFAQLDIANKDNKAAEADLKAAIALKQDYTDAIFLLSQLEVQDGDVKDALSSALAAAYFTPNNPNILFQVGILYAATNDFQNAAAALEAAVTADPQFANARYFLAAVYAKQNDMKDALAQMQAIAALSADNAKAVASQITALTAGTNPFPANLLSASSTPVKQ